jgi:hypothetical protein
MKRFRRWLVNGIVATSAFLCGIAIVLWVRGRSVNDEVYLNLRSHLVILGSFPNHFDCVFYRAANFRGPFVEVFARDKHVPAIPEFWTFRVLGNAFQWEIGVPWWLFLIGGLALPGIAVSRRLKRIRDEGKGRCVVCGYDLRATPERCPECGTVPRKKGLAGLA